MAGEGRGTKLRWGLNLGLGIGLPLVAVALMIFPFLASPAQVDYHVWSSYIFTLAMLLFLFLLVGAARALVHVLVAIFSKARRPRSLPAAIGAALTVAIVLGGFRADRIVMEREMDNAIRNAERLLPALESFRSQSGNYPDRLAQLAPKFISVLPSSTCGMISDPAYLPSEGKETYRLRITVYEFWSNPLLEYASVNPCNPAKVSQDCPGESCACRGKWKTIFED